MSGSVRILTGFGEVLLALPVDLPKVDSEVDPPSVVWYIVAIIGDWRLVQAYLCLVAARRLASKESSSMPTFVRPPLQRREGDVSVSASSSETLVLTCLRSLAISAATWSRLDCGVVRAAVDSASNAAVTPYITRASGCVQGGCRVKAAGSRLDVVEIQDVNDLKKKRGSPLNKHYPWYEAKGYIGKTAGRALKLFVR